MIQPGAGLIGLGTLDGVHMRIYKKENVVSWQPHGVLEAEYAHKRATRKDTGFLRWICQETIGREARIKALSMRGVSLS